MHLKFDSSLKFWNAFSCIKYNREFKRNNPFSYDDYGLVTFCGPQGSGKTLSAVRYVLQQLDIYPLLILVTNVELSSYPCNARLEDDFIIYDGAKYPISCADGLADMLFYTERKHLVIEYDGLDCLKKIENGYAGVLYFIDELQLEFNSLESKNIGIDQMVEFCQQRKQRKSIVGTTQVFMRLAKPVREQIYDVVACQSYFKYFQLNKYFDGQKAYEKDGELVCPSSRSYCFFHSSFLYNEYNTYKKMRRYKKEWKGRSYRYEG